MRGLTIKQPWAWLLASGFKDVENRVWAPPQWIRGEWIALHAAGRSVELDAADRRYIAARLKLAGGLALQTFDAAPKALGAVLAVALVSHTVLAPGGRWGARWHRRGMWGWQFDRVVPLLHPVACPGGQRLWNLPPAVAELLAPYDAA